VPGAPPARSHRASRHRAFARKDPDRRCRPRAVRRARGRVERQPCKQPTNRQVAALPSQSALKQRERALPSQRQPHGRADPQSAHAFRQFRRQSRVSKYAFSFALSSASPDVQTIRDVAKDRVRQRRESTEKPMWFCGDRLAALPAGRNEERAAEENRSARKRKPCLQVRRTFRCATSQICEELESCTFTDLI
jgi:hypothetical protein